MKTYNRHELYDLIQKLNGGDIQPIGSTEYDDSAFKRQKEIQGLTNFLLHEVFNVLECPGNEASVECAREEASRWLRGLWELIGEVIDEVEEREEK